MYRIITSLSLAGIGLWLAPLAASAISIATVPVGNVGNTGEVQPQGTFGSVAYEYRIATTEVTNAQYVDFLNAVAATDTYGLYESSMGTSTSAGIVRTGSSGSYIYSVKPNAGAYTYGNKPVNLVTWYDTLRFANWLNNGQPSGIQDASTTEDGAYTFSGATSVGSRNSGASWFLPSEDEWYKAAYYNGGSATYADYPTGATPNNNLPTSDTGNSANFKDGGFATGDSSYPMTDAGAYTLSASSYGTFDQGGNLSEWNETLVSGSKRGVRGGSWNDNSSILLASSRIGFDPTIQGLNIGFRMATIVPEPSSCALAACGLTALAGARLGRNRRRGANH